MAVELKSGRMLPLVLCHIPSSAFLGMAARSVPAAPPAWPFVTPPPGLYPLSLPPPQTRQSVAFSERQVVSGVMSGIVPPAEPGVSALLARFAAQHSGGGSGAPGSSSVPIAPAGPVPPAAAGLPGGLQANGPLS